MRHIFTATLLAFALTGCSANEGIDGKAFAAAEETALVKESASVTCSAPVKREGISFTQKCWTWAYDKNNPQYGEPFAQFGLALARFDTGVLEILQQTPTGHILRYDNKDDCAYYFITTLSETTPSKDDTSGALEYGLAVSEKPHCGTLAES